MLHGLRAGSPAHECAWRPFPSGLAAGRGMPYSPAFYPLYGSMLLQAAIKPPFGLRESREVIAPSLEVLIQGS
jgi:hypothetical protein